MRLLELLIWTLNVSEFTVETIYSICNETIIKYMTYEKLTNMCVLTQHVHLYYIQDIFQ